MRKIISMLLIVLVFTIVGCSNTDSNQNDSKIEESSAIGYGVSSDSGNWNIRIKSVSEVSEVPKKDGGQFIADGKFINILIEISNISKNPISYSLTEFKLKDKLTDKTYSIEDIGYNVAHELISEEKFYKNNDEYITIMDDVNPDKSKIACISFEVSKELNIENLVLINKNKGSNGEVEFLLR